MADYVTINTGSTISISAESVGTIFIQKVKLVDSTAGSTAGTGVLSNPLVVSGSTTVINTVSITGSTSVINTVAVTGSVLVINPVSSPIPVQPPASGYHVVSGSTSVINTVAITGSTSVINTVSVTGSTTIIGNVSLAAPSSGGLLVANFNTGDTYTALTNAAQAIKASAGQLYGYYIYNPNVTAAYVLVYNTAAASVTVGTTTAQMVFCVPAGSAANQMFTHGIDFTNAGWSCAATTTGGGNTACTTALEVMFWYK